jgi:hypothetical protein
MDEVEQEIIMSKSNISKDEIKDKESSPKLKTEEEEKFIKSQASIVEEESKNEP